MRYVNIGEARAHFCGSPAIKTWRTTAGLYRYAILPQQQRLGRATRKKHSIYGQVSRPCGPAGWVAERRKSRKMRIAHICRAWSANRNDERSLWARGEYLPARGGQADGRFRTWCVRHQRDRRLTLWQASWLFMTAGKEASPGRAARCLGGFMELIDALAAGNYWKYCFMCTD